MHDMRNGICPLCDHREVVARSMTEFTGERSVEVAMAVVHGPRDGVFDSRLAHPLGRLQVYVCRGCGFAQWFADRPAEIPIDAALGTELIRGPEREGYR